MAKAFIDDTHLTDIADAIRATLDESRQYLPSEMAAAIDSIPVMAQLNRKKYFQAVPAGAASGYATIEQVEGNTVAWNQLVDTSDTSCTVPNGHKYYSIIGGTKSISTSDGTSFAVTGGTDVVIDLTAIFGSGNEPTTVADFETWMAQNIGTLPYYDYNAGELLNVKMQSVKSVGFNQWDEQWEVGTINSSGQNATSTTRIRSKNYIPVIAGKSYYITPKPAISVKTYDASNTFIATLVGVNNIYDIPTNVAYIRFNIGSSTDPTTSYNHDICINLSDPAKNGTYKPYQSDSADIDVTTITGINTATNVREVIFPTGMKQADREGMIKDTLDLRSDTATVKVGSVDMGNLSWSGNPFRTDSVAKAVGTGNILCAIYPNAESYSFLQEKEICGVSSTVRIFVNDSSYATAADFKTGVAGIMLNYELATPITYTDLQDANGNPLNPRYKVEQGGTEQVLPANTSTPTTVAPTLSTIYKKNI